MTSKRKNPCTNWFPGSVKPVRKGVYRVYMKGGAKTRRGEVWYSYFNGNTFGYVSLDRFRAFEMRNHDTKAVVTMWLGLANDPEKVAR